MCIRDRRKIDEVLGINVSWRDIEASEGAYSVACRGSLWYNALELLHAHIILHLIIYLDSL